MEKKLGQVFTSKEITRRILDEAGYIENIIDKKIMEPSFGKGVFLVEIIDRLIKACKSEYMTDAEIISKLESNIYGIEIDTNLYNTALCNIDRILSSYGLNKVKLHLYNEDAITFSTDEKFDFVVGNPPYIRIHNLDSDVRKKIDKFKFTNGTTDMYIVFFEIGINMLSENGKLAFITPNSYIKNTSQKALRDFLTSNNLIEKIIDFKDEQVFDTVDTYTAITVLNKCKTSNNISYISKDETKKDICLDIEINKLKDTERWEINTKEIADFLTEIEKRDTKLGSIANIQYGISTNCDNVYLINPIKTTDSGKFTKFKKGNKDCLIESEILKPVIKGSRYAGEEITTKIIFPYKKDGNNVVPLTETELRNKYPLCYWYLYSFKKELDKRDLDKNAQWFQYARSQGIKKILNKKLVFQHVISNNLRKIKTYLVDEETIVYSGIFITSDENLELVKDSIEKEEFCTYCKALGKDMSGGYKSITTKIVKSFKINI